MFDAFQNRMPDGTTVEQLVFGPLDKSKAGITVVDAGARNGMLLAPSLARRTRIIGFEPNPAEYEKLKGHSTDAQRAGVPIASFKDEEYYNCALWNKEEERQFYITAGTGACTLMGETVGQMTERMWLEGRDQSYGALHTQVKTTLPIPCKRLDSVLASDRKIDYFKLDVEGAELAILEGASALFANKSILFIKTEFVFTPYYKIHPVLGFQHVFLHEHGFRLIDLDLAQPRYARDRTTIPALADRRLIYAGDAYFMLDPDRQTLAAEDLHRMAITSIALGFHSLGVSLLRDSGVFDAQALMAIETALAQVSLRRTLKQAWNRVPLTVARFLARFG